MGVVTRWVLVDNVFAPEADRSAVWLADVVGDPSGDAGFREVLRSLAAARIGEAGGGGAVQEVDWNATGRRLSLLWTADGAVMLGQVVGSVRASVASTADPAVFERQAVDMALDTLAHCGMAVNDGLYAMDAVAEAATNARRVLEEARVLGAPVPGVPSFLPGGEPGDDDEAEWDRVYAAIERSAVLG